MPSRHRSGVTIFYRDSPAFAVEAICQFGADVIVCQLETRESRWYIFGCYLAPRNNTTIRDVEAAMAERPRGTYFIFANYFNVGI